MVDEAHRLGMYVIVDIVANHMANLFYFEGHANDGAPFRMHVGEYRLLPRDPNEIYTDFKVDNTFFPTGNYGEIYGYDGFPKSEPGGGSYWNSDFHHNGDIGDYGDPWQNHLGKIYGIMDDLRNEHPRVQDKLIAMTKSLISSTDIDGIRMDTPMQVPLSFFKRWVPAVKAHARSLGKNNFFVFGSSIVPVTVRYDGGPWAYARAVGESIWVYRQYFRDGRGHQLRFLFQVHPSVHRGPARRPAERYATVSGRHEGV